MTARQRVSRVLLFVPFLSSICILQSVGQSIRLPSYRPQAADRNLQKQEQQEQQQQEQQQQEQQGSAVTPDCRDSGIKAGNCKFVLWFPTLPKHMGGKDIRDINSNAFYQTEGTVSYFNQIKSIYNGAASSATVSADVVSMNFSNGMQVSAGTNIQAGSSDSPAVIGTGAIPTLSATSAAQATQNMLYGGTIAARVLYPILYYSPVSVTSVDGLGMSVNLVGTEGIDLQNFKSGTSSNVTAPPSHASAQLEGYLQYTSTNLSTDKSGPAGAIFFGGSYGYSYTSHNYARNYGFSTNVSNGMGQVSAGILVSGVAKIAVSRGFGPSQTYIDSTSNIQVIKNNFKTWSFGITYQSPPPKT